MTNEEELMLKSVVMDGYEQFVEAIANGRNMDREDVYAVADGSVFTGLQAYNLGLVDTLGGLADAVKLAADLAGLEGEPEVVRPREKRRGFWTEMLSGVLGDLGQELRGAGVGPRLMYIYR